MVARAGVPAGPEQVVEEPAMDPLHLFSVLSFVLSLLKMILQPACMQLQVKAQIQSAALLLCSLFGKKEELL